jgi:hypothetical protein
MTTFRQGVLYGAPNTTTDGNFRFASCEELPSIKLLLGKPNTVKVTICLETFQDRYLPRVLLTAVNVYNSLPCPSGISEGKRPFEKPKHRWGDTN